MSDSFENGPDLLIQKVFSMKTKILLLAITLGTMFYSADAQTIKQKSQHQRHRIHHGVKNGELTRHETKNLIHGQKEIHQDVKSAKADGVVTNQERKSIKQDQRQESRDIFRKKHNGRDRN